MVQEVMYWDASASHELDPSLPVKIEDFQTILEGLLRSYGNGHSDKFQGLIKDMRMVLGEAVANAMKHGNRWNPKKNVMMIAWICGNRLTISVQDEGQGIDPARIPTKHQVQDVMTREIRSSSGRGLAIMAHFLDEVKVSQDQPNKLILIKYLNF